MKRIVITILVALLPALAQAQVRAEPQRGTCESLRGIPGALFSQSVTSGEASYKTCFGWDNQGNLSGVVDSSGFMTFLRYDLLGRLLSNIDPYLEETLYQYDAQSRLQQLTQTNRFNPAGSPANRTLVLGYDSIGNVVSQQIGGGDSSRLHYTPDETVKAVVGPDNALGSSMEYNFSGFLESTGLGIVNDQGEVAEGPLGRLRYEYDDAGRVSAAVDGADRRTTFLYDDLGKISEVRLPNNASVFTRYDDAGRVRVRESRDYGGAILSRTEINYDAMDRPVEARTYRPGNNTVWKVVWNYEDNGLTMKVRYILNNIIYAKELKRFDNLGRIVDREMPGAGSMRWSYDNAGRPAQISHNATGLIQSYQYDALGRLRSIRDPLGNISTFQFDGLGNLTTLGQPAGSQTRIRYDANGRPVSTTAGSLQMEHLYDAAGRSRGTNLRDPNGAWQIPGELSAYQRETGLLASTAIGQRIVYQILERNETGQVVRAADGISTEFHFYYDSIGQLIQIAAQKHSGELKYRNFSYYYDGRLKTVGESVEIPADRFSEFRGFGNHSYNILTRAINRLLGRPIYDSRLKSVVSFSYDAVGNLTSESRWIQGVWRITNLQRSATGSGLWTTHVYPSGFRMERREDSAFRLNLAQGRLSDGSFAARAAFDYLPNSLRLDRVHFGNDVAEERYSYDAAGRVTGLGVFKTPAGDERPIAQIDYKYSPNSAVIAQREMIHPAEGQNLAKHFTFNYDDLGRMLNWSAVEGGAFDGIANNVASAPENGAAVQRYIYRADGVRGGFSTRGGPNLGLGYVERSVRYEHREDGAPLSASLTDINIDGIMNLSFDPDGNGNILAARAGNEEGPTYEYDAFGRLAAVNDPAHNNRRIEYQYDGLGRLISRQVSENGNVVGDQEFIWDGASLSEVIDVPERNASGEIRWGLQKITSYLYGFGSSHVVASYQHDGARTRYHHSHPDGSVFLLTTEAGAVTQWYRYSPFGETSVLDWIQNAEEARDLGDSRTLRLFGSAIVDPATGLYCMGDAWWDPVHGYFLGGR